MQLYAGLRIYRQGADVRFRRPPLRVKLHVRHHHVSNISEASVISVELLTN